MGAPVVQMGKVTEVGMRVGMTFTIMSLGALAGPPISGAILDRTGSFEHVGYYAGTFLSAFGLFYLAFLTHVILQARPSWYRWSSWA